jgi:hypothetical protein
VESFAFRAGRSPYSAFGAEIDICIASRHRKLHQVLLRSEGW